MPQNNNDGNIRVDINQETIDNAINQAGEDIRNGIDDLFKGIMQGGVDFANFVNDGAENVAKDFENFTSDVVDRLEKNKTAELPIDRFANRDEIGLA